MSITLRPARDADHAALRALDPRLIAEASLPGALPEDFVRFQRRITDKALADTNPKSHLIVVAENAADQGTGSKLMEVAEEWARERRHPSLLLDVFASNETIRGCYERAGFEENSLRLRRDL
jgi:GNAT superfamily N-acetyltransferase